MTTLLLTGAAGFIGAHTVEGLLQDTDWDIVVMDRLSYAGRLDRLAHLKDNPRLRFVFHDFRAALRPDLVREIGDVDYIIHMGGETHVDHSITDPIRFVLANNLGTTHMLNYARGVENLKKFIFVSTDEVFGPAPDGVDYREWDRHRPGNPYAASKSGADAMTHAFSNTYDLPSIVSTTMNCFGERQHPEKLIPIIVRKLLAGDPITIHGDAETQGIRAWLHARNHGDGLLHLLEHGEPGERYNIVGEEHTNLEIARMAADILGKELEVEWVPFAEVRPGHDRRYALDGSKMTTLGWEPPLAFKVSFSRCVEWMRDHPEWL